MPAPRGPADHQAAGFRWDPRSHKRFRRAFARACCRREYFPLLACALIRNALSDHALLATAPDNGGRERIPFAGGNVQGKMDALSRSSPTLASAPISGSINPAAGVKRPAADP